jgi:hypothetical protein
MDESTKARVAARKLAWYHANKVLVNEKRRERYVKQANKTEWKHPKVPKKECPVCAKMVCETYLTKHIARKHSDE